MWGLYIRRENKGWCEGLILVEGRSVGRVSDRREGREVIRGVV